MRIKILGDIISKTDQSKTNYNHGIYSMFIANLDEPLSSIFTIKIQKNIDYLPFLMSI